MSLYEDVDTAESKPASDISDWGSHIKMLQVQRQLQQAGNKARAGQTGKVKRGPTVTPVYDLKAQSEGPMTFNLATGKMERGPPTTGGSMFIANEPPLGALTGVADEYDPFRPNEYEYVVRKKREKAREERRELEKKREEEEKEREKEREKELKERKSKRSRHDEDEEIERFERTPARKGEGSDDDDEDEREREKFKRSSGNTFAPPSSLTIDSQKESNSGNNSDSEDFDGKPLEDSPPHGHKPAMKGGFGRGSIAMKMMAKMGYKSGQGLGKKESGITTALQVEKTSKRGGRIIKEEFNNSPEPQQAGTPPPGGVSARQPPTNVDLMKNPTKVVCLRNMVGPGEVDEDLEPETAEECTKYGKVTKCLIFEVPNVEQEEGVRIFVEFEAMAAAIKAIVDLNGRFFGGRQVRACFYNHDKFKRLELNEEVM